MTVFKKQKRLLGPRIPQKTAALVLDSVIFINS